MERLRTVADSRRGMQAYLEANPDAAFEAFVACGNCRVIRIHPTPTGAVLGRFYTHYSGNVGYANKSASKTRRATKRIAMLTKQTGAVAGARFLDVGCNLGFAVEAARLGGFSATGIEIGTQAVEQAKTLFPENRFIATTAEEFAQTGERFDVVYCAEVIEHVPDVRAFAQALAQLVAPGGTLFLTTPDAGHWRRNRNFLAWLEVKPPEHVNWQTRQSLAMLFMALGFERPRFRFNLKPGIKMLVKRAA